MKESIYTKAKRIKRDEKICILYKNGYSVRDIARDFNVTRGIVYCAVQRMHKADQELEKKLSTV